MVRPHDAIPGRMESSQGTGLNVVIEMELVRVRAQPNGIDLLVAFVIQPSFDHVLGEDIAAQQERVIGLERIQRLLQRAGGRLHLLRLRRRQVIEVLVDGLTRVDAILDAVEARHQHRRERRYPLHEGSGERNSTRFAGGFGEYIGILQRARRLRCKEPRWMGARYPGTRRGYGFGAGAQSPTSAKACSSKPPM